MWVGSYSCSILLKFLGSGAVYSSQVGMEFGEDMITHDCPVGWMHLRNNYAGIKNPS